MLKISRGFPSDNTILPEAVHRVGSGTSYKIRWRKHLALHLQNVGLHPWLVLFSHSEPGWILPEGSQDEDDACGCHAWIRPFNRWSGPGREALGGAAGLRFLSFPCEDLMALVFVQALVVFRKGKCTFRVGQFLSGLFDDSCLYQMLMLSDSWEESAKFV